jgi:ABC-type polysaccharide/polyol phosphate export permease
MPNKNMDFIFGGIFSTGLIIALCIYFKDIYEVVDALFVILMFLIPILALIDEEFRENLRRWHL